MKKELNEILSGFHADVLEFHKKMGLPISRQPKRLAPERKAFRAKFMDEELVEYSEATDWADEVDGLVDLIYVAMGTLIEMGADPNMVWREVHEKNMQKVRGENASRPGSGGNDAVKPEGWTPPDHDAIRRELLLRSAVSPALLEATRIRMIRSAKYNNGNVRLEDHFPLGPASYFQMIWTKVIRLRSMMQDPDGVDEKIMWDSLRDFINYSSFWMEDSVNWTEGQKWGSD